MGKFHTHTITCSSSALDPIRDVLGLGVEGEEEQSQGTLLGCAKSAKSVSSWM